MFIFSFLLLACTIDEEQLKWFEQFLIDHPADKGYKIFVFTHAPPNGSGLRILQENHVVNGCCWLNHSDELQCRKFIELVREHRSIKGWFSGHFHLGQDYQDSMSFPTIDPSEGPYPNRGSCVFAQTSVMRGGTSRDGRQQSRLLRGNKDGFEILTIDHQQDGKVRLDATITFRDDTHEVGTGSHQLEALGILSQSHFQSSSNFCCCIFYSLPGEINSDRSLRSRRCCP